jgi:hypothetical protein
VSKYNPKKIDYNKDGAVDGYDDQFAVKDYNKDGKVNDKEETRYRKERDTTNTKYVYEGDKLVLTEVTGSGKEEPPEPSLDFAQYTDRFLRKHPEIRDLIDKAIKFNWNEEQFIRNVENTDWGKSTTDAEAAFDLQIMGSKAEELTDKDTGKIPLMARDIQKMLESAGVTATPEEIKTFARTAIRSALDQDAIQAWIAGKYVVPTQEPTTTPPAEGETGGGTAPQKGTAALISEQLSALADSYGLPVTSDFLQEKVREGLGQDNWQEWVQGQRDIFRQQAKLSYPTVSDQLEKYTLNELMTPYLNAATQMLGVPRSEMKLDDPMWNSALRGAAGGPMGMDEWIKTVRTDSKYGWTKTAAAKQEASDLATGIIRAFGMS